MCETENIVALFLFVFLLKNTLTKKEVFFFLMPLETILPLQSLVNPGHHSRFQILVLIFHTNATLSFMASQLAPQKNKKKTNSWEALPQVSPVWKSTEFAGDEIKFHPSTSSLCCVAWAQHILPAPTLSRDTAGAHRGKRSGVCTCVFPMPLVVQLHASRLCRCLPACCLPCCSRSACLNRTLPLNVNLMQRVVHRCHWGSRQSQIVHCDFQLQQEVTAVAFEFLVKRFLRQLAHQSHSQEQIVTAAV